MKKRVKKIFVLSVGIVFLIFGTLGLALPFLQGIFLLVIGIFLISFSFPKSRQWIKKRVEKNPRLLSFVEKNEQWLKKFFEEK